jgi:predicted nucleic acid-binding protein
MRGTPTRLPGCASSAQLIAAELVRCERPARHDRAHRPAKGAAGDCGAPRSPSSTREIPFPTPINVEEIHRGLRESERTAAINLFDGLRIAPIDRLQGVQAGDWRRDHASNGVALAQADCMIAAVAVAIGAPLATGIPKHFPMRELRVEHWPVGA